MTAAIAGLGPVREHQFLRAVWEHPAGPEGDPSSTSLWGRQAFDMLPIDLHVGGNTSSLPKALISSLPGVATIRLETVRRASVCIDLEKAAQGRNAEEEQVVVHGSRCSADAKRLRISADPMCAFLSSGIRRLREARHIRGFILISIGTAGQASPFHWRTLRAMSEGQEEACGPKSMESLRSLLREPKLLAWFLMQDYPVNMTAVSPQRPDFISSSAYVRQWQMVRDEQKKIRRLHIGVEPRWSSQLLIHHQRIAAALAGSDFGRTTLMYVNVHLGKPGRNLMWKRMRANFQREGEILQNYYPLGGMVDIQATDALQDLGSAYVNYTNGLLTSKFVFSPSGSGLDCYRTWEALAMGAIPVLEDSALMRELLAGLPALFIRDWNSVSPSYLRDEYERIVRQSEQYNFTKLLTKYVVDQVRKIQLQYTTQLRIETLG
mmetsp:Transcript_686/g.1384  ORF Transcript_686/g.1384 Transcript_686/m.1384 type:complete len:435 (-) Transcript_686:243-1547(-)